MPQIQKVPLDFAVQSLVASFTPFGISGKVRAMSNCCGPVKAENEHFKRAVKIALLLNFSMFIVEVVTSLLAHSSALKADALDFLGDSANYVISLYVLNKAVSLRSKATLIKGLTMSVFAVWVFIDIFLNLKKGIFPQFEIMGLTGTAAFIVNLSVAFMLYKFREGDSNMQSVWLCSRNDAIGNIAVILAALSVKFLNTNLPDLIVALFMATLASLSGYKIIRLSLRELKHGTTDKVESKSCCG